MTRRTVLLSPVLVPNLVPHAFGAGFSGVGQCAAYNLAQRLTRIGVFTEVVIPPVRGTDWLDVLNNKGGSA